MADTKRETTHYPEQAQASWPSIPSPSILGYYALTISTFIVAVGLAGGFTGFARQEYVLSFATIFGGLALLLASMWAFRARDALSTIVHGVWGFFYMGFGALFLVSARGFIAAPTLQFIALGYWFVPLAIVTFSAAVAATRVSLAMFSTLFLLGLGASIAAVGFFSGLAAVLIASGWVLIFASLAAWWTATGLLFEAVLGYSPLPLYRRVPAQAENEEPLIVRQR